MPITSDFPRGNISPENKPNNPVKEQEKYESHFSERKDPLIIEEENAEMRDYILERFPNAFEEVVLEDGTKGAILKDWQQEDVEVASEKDKTPPPPRPLSEHLVAFSKDGFTLIHKEYAKVLIKPTSFAELKKDLNLKDVFSAISQAEDVVSGKNPLSRTSLSSSEESMDYVFVTYKKGITVKDIKSWSPYFKTLDENNKRVEDIKSESNLRTSIKVQYFR